MTSALGATRTRGPLLRKQMLYPLSYEGIYRFDFNRFLQPGQPGSNMYNYVYNADPRFATFFQRFYPDLAVFI